MKKSAIAMKVFFRSLRRNLANAVHVDLGVMTLLGLRALPSHIRCQRATIMKTRVVGISFAFSILVLSWGVIDFFAFSSDVFFGLFAKRAVVSLLLLGISLWAASARRMSEMFVILSAMLAILAGFYFMCRLPQPETSYGGMVQTSYTLLPFIPFAGLGLFPLTLAESTLLAAPLLALFMASVSGFVSWRSLPLNMGDIWVMALLGGISALTGLSQLRLLARQINMAAYDVLTGCLSRKYGEQVIDMTWNMGRRYNCRYALAYVGLDHFKQVNAAYGPTLGDEVLMAAADAMRQCLRTSDILIRWGGADFMVALPDTDAQGGMETLQRLMDRGFGARPDGAQQTASIGMAERGVDNVVDWRDLVRRADERLALAQSLGQNQYVGPSACAEDERETA